MAPNPSRLLTIVWLVRAEFPGKLSINDPFALLRKITIRKKLKNTFFITNQRLKKKNILINKIRYCMHM